LRVGRKTVTHYFGHGKVHHWGEYTKRRWESLVEKGGRGSRRNKNVLLI